MSDDLNEEIDEMEHGRRKLKVTFMRGPAFLYIRQYLYLAHEWQEKVDRSQKNGKRSNVNTRIWAAEGCETLQLKSS